MKKIFYIVFFFSFTIISLAITFQTFSIINKTYAADRANVGTHYIPYTDKVGTIDVVFCSENNYYRSDTFTLGYACYKAIDERSQGFGTRLDLEKKGDYAIYELPAVSKINKMELIFYKGDKRQYDITVQAAVAGSHVQGDVEAVKWKTIFKGKTADVGRGEAIPEPVVLNFKNVKGQFIRIIGNGAYADGKLNTLLTEHTAIIDIQIFGEKTNEVYTYSNK